MNLVRTAVVTSTLAVVVAVLTGCNAGEETSAPITSSGQVAVTMTVRMVGAHTLTVDQHVQFAASSYSVAVFPDPPPSSPGSQARFRPSITRLRVTAPGQQVQQIRQVNYDTRVSFDVPIREVDLHYRMTGVAEHQRPSVPGRFLVYVTALSVESSAGADRVITVRGALNLGCLDGSRPLRVCGHQTSDGWTVHLSPDRASTAVLAQLQAT